MSFPITELTATEFPPLLREIPQPPESLNYRGTLPPSHLTLLSVAGSRKYTTYGKQVVEELLSGLKNYPIGIVSGLALGVDSLAHEAALKNNLYTLAIPGGGLDDSVIYPASHKPLAHRILEAGGGLLSEYASDFKATEWSFPRRNRLVAGISKATLLIEAAEKSGTLITARMTVDYNRELLVVPGSIFSKTSTGVHQFLKLGATPVTESKDILDALGIEQKEPDEPTARPALTPLQTQIVDLLHEPTHRDEIIRKTGGDTTVINRELMLLELQNIVHEDNNMYRAT